MNKLHKLGLGIMLLAVVVHLVCWYVILLTAEEPTLSSALITGSLLWLLYGGPALILTVISWRWPHTGSIITIVFSLIALAIWLWCLLADPFQMNPMLIYINILTTIVLLSGGILVLTSSKKNP